MAPSVCKVIGTGMPGSGIGGIRLKTTISAANSAISTVLLDFMASPLRNQGCARRPQGLRASMASATSWARFNVSTISGTIKATG
ncbi:hypothetical protein G6F65_022844 [Rhizopus arrhizus]|nr:hypothetical protein G6F65_022844 [Rhizopus arrhizus]